MRTDRVGVGSVLYLSVLSTVVAFGLWGHLITLYPAGLVAPFFLLVPLLEPSRRPWCSASVSELSGRREWVSCSWGWW